LFYNWINIGISKGDEPDLSIILELIRITAIILLLGSLMGAV